MKPFSTCIVAVLRRGLEALIQITAARTEWCTCSPQQNLTRSPSLCWSAQSVGLQRFSNPKGRMMEAAGGCAFFDETVRGGKRQSIFRSYVYALMDQPNITVLTGAL